MVGRNHTCRTISGGCLYPDITNGQPIGFHRVLTGTARWIQRFKDTTLKHCNQMVNIGAHGSSMPISDNYLDLDPACKDAWGQPLLRMTCDLPNNDLKTSQYVTGKLQQIGKATGSEQVAAASQAIRHQHVPVHPQLLRLDAGF